MSDDIDESNHKLIRHMEDASRVRQRLPRARWPVTAREHDDLCGEYGCPNDSTWRGDRR